jgi:hypothetical protein
MYTEGKYGRKDYHCTPPLPPGMVMQTKKTHSVSSVRERTIPTEQSPLVKCHVLRIEECRVVSAAGPLLP